MPELRRRLGACSDPERCHSYGGGSRRGGSRRGGSRRGGSRRGGSRQGGRASARAISAARSSIDGSAEVRRELCDDERTPRPLTNPTRHGLSLGGQGEKMLLAASEGVARVSAVKRSRDDPELQRWNGNGSDAKRRHRCGVRCKSERATSAARSSIDGSAGHDERAPRPLTKLHTWYGLWLR